MCYSTLELDAENQARKDRGGECINTSYDTTQVRYSAVRRQRISSGNT